MFGLIPARPAHGHRPRGAHRLSHGTALLALLTCIACGDTGPAPATPVAPGSTPTPVAVGPTAAAPTAAATRVPVATAAVPPTLTPGAPPESVVGGPTGADVDLVGYAGKRLPYAVFYPPAWKVMTDTAQSVDFPALPDFLAIGSGDSAMAGIYIYSGATVANQTARTLAEEFIGRQKQQGTVDTSTNDESAGAVSLAITTTTKLGPIIGDVEVVVNPAHSYLAYSFTQSGHENDFLQPRFFAFAPLTAYPAPATADLAVQPTRLAGLGSIRCPNGWTGSSDSSALTLECHNAGQDSMESATIRVEPASADTAEATVAAYTQNLASSPYAGFRLAPDLWEYAETATLAGDRLTFLRLVPAPGGRLLMITSDSADDEEKILPSILSFQPEGGAAARP
jgi:hypothetical protein